MFGLKERRTFLLPEKVPLVRRHALVICLPLGRTLKIHRDLLIEFGLGNLRRDRYHRTAHSAVTHESQPLPRRNAPFVIGTVQVHIARRCTRKFAGIQTHRCPVRIEIDDESVDAIVHGTLWRRCRCRAHEDDSFVGPREAQPIVNLGNGAFGTLEPVHLLQLLHLSSFERGDIGIGA
jgi:hypothetical protein